MARAFRHFGDARERDGRVPVFGAKPKSRRRSRLFELLVSAVAGLSIVYVGAHALGVLGVQPTASGPGVQVGNELYVSFGLCDGPVRTTCVVDGDTIWIDGTKIRIADINAPEISSPECRNELIMGRQATLRMVGLLNAGPITLSTYGSRDEDRFGRKLRVVSRNGESLGRVLVAEGLAEEWNGVRVDWCV